MLDSSSAQPYPERRALYRNRPQPSSSISTAAAEYLLGGLRTVSAKIRVWLILLFGVVVLLLAKPGLLLPGLRLYDDWRLGRFASRIAACDRIVCTLSHSAISVTLADHDVRTVIGTVSSASPARLPFGRDYAAAYDMKATFFQGTEAVGDIRICGSLFRITPNGAPFKDETGSIRALIGNPILEAYGTMMEGLESQ
ncbi:MAG: hypothetical protein KJ072_14385 [Verrucomicrobia bacterium]|nr:hypothetical protein [Verrucomicrobiota bacterium]